MAIIVNCAVAKTKIAIQENNHRDVSAGAVKVVVIVFWLIGGRPAGPVVPRVGHFVGATAESAVASHRPLQ